MDPLVWLAHSVWEEYDAPGVLPRYLLAYDHYEAIEQAGRRDLVLWPADPTDRQPPTCTALSLRRVQEICRQKCRERRARRRGGR